MLDVTAKERREGRFRIAEVPGKLDSLLLEFSILIVVSRLR